MIQLAKARPHRPRRRSLLDSAINHLRAQRAGLNAVADLIAGRDGPVLEIGLGAGHSYDHLCRLMPNRDIYAFDRVRPTNRESMPPTEFFFVGELAETLLCAAAALGPRAILAHVDISSGRPDLDAEAIFHLSRHLPMLLAEDAIVLCDQRLSHPRLKRAAALPGVAEDRYFVYRKSGFALQPKPRAVGSAEGIRAA